MKLNGFPIEDYNAKLLDRSIEPTQFRNDILSTFGSNSKLRVNRVNDTKRLNVSLEFKGSKMDIHENKGNLMRFLTYNPFISFDAIPGRRFVGYLESVSSAEQNSMFEVLDLSFIVYEEDLLETEVKGVSTMQVPLFNDGTMDSPAVVEITPRTKPTSDLKIEFIGFRNKMSVIYEKGSTGTIIVDALNTTVRQNNVSKIKILDAINFPRVREGDSTMRVALSEDIIVDYKIKYRRRWI